MWTYFTSVYYLQNRDKDNLLDDKNFYDFLNKIIAFIWTYAVYIPGVNALRTPVYAEMINIVNNNPILEMTITKNRYGKSGKETKCIYNWNPDINTYTYIQNIEDINNDEETKQETEENKENFKSIF